MFLSRSLVALILLSSLAFGAGSAEGAFSPAARISTATTDAADVDAAVNPSGLGAVAWSQGGRVYVRVLAADGAFPEPPVDLTALTAGDRTDELPDVAVDANGSVHVAYLSTAAGGTDRAVLVASLDSGSSAFVVNRASRAAQATSEDPGEFSRVRVAAGEGGRVTVAWNTATGRVLVATRHAPPMGTNPAFAAPAELAATGGGFVAVATGRLGGGPTTVAWSAASHFHAASRPEGGTTFSAPVQVDDGTGTPGPAEVAVRETDGRSFVAFTQTESGADNVFLASQRAADGPEYTAPVAVGITGGSDDFAVRMAAAGSHLALTWMSGNTPTSFRVLARRQTATEGPPALGAIEELSPAGAQGVNPAVDVATGGEAVVSWNELATSRTVASVAPGSAAPFGPAQQLTVSGDAPGSGTAPMIMSAPAPRATVAFLNQRGMDGMQVYAASGPLAASSSVSFSQPSYTVAEGAGTLSITLQRPAGGAAGSVRVRSTNGDAVAGADFTAVDQVVSFADGQTSATFSVTILQDTTDEQAEPFSLALTTESGNAVPGDPASAPVFITDDDDPPVTPTATATASATATATATTTAAPVDTTTTPGVAVPISATEEQAKMPNLLPRRSGKRYKYRTVAVATRGLEEAGINLKVDTRPVRASEAGDAKIEADLKARGRGGEIVVQKPAPGTRLESTVTQPVTVRLTYYDPFEERRYQEQIEREAKERLERERKRIEDERKERERVEALNRCYLLGLRDGADGGTPPTLASIFQGRRFESLPKERIKTWNDVGAVDILTKLYDCKWEAKFEPVRGFVDSTVIDVRQDVARNLIELKVAIPVKPDFTLTFREDPSRLTSPNQVSFVERPDGDWVLPVNRGTSSVFTVQVNEIATGNFVQNATIEIYSGRTGKRIGTGRTDANGEDWFTAGLVEDTLTFIVRYPGQNGRTAEGFRSVSVVDLGASFRTICGRTIQLKNGSHQGTQADLNTCKGFPLVPANLGTGEGSAPPQIAKIQQVPVFKVDGTGATATAIGGEHNAIPIRAENTIVAAAGGVIATGGGNVISTGGGNRRAAGLGPIAQATQFGNPFAGIGSLVNAIVTPLATAYSQGVANIRKALDQATASLVAQTSQALIKAGAPVPAANNLISDKGLGVISTGGGNLIGQAGGNVIATGGGNLIGQAGGNLISDKGLGVIATGGGNVMPVYGGRVIATGGGNR